MKWFVCVVCVVACGRGRLPTGPSTDAKKTAASAGPTIQPATPPASALATARVWPHDGSTVPVNLAWIVVELSEPMTRASVLNLTLQNGADWALPRFIGATTEPFLSRAVLYGPFDDSRCYEDEPGQLCNGLVYQLVSTSGLVAQNGVVSTAPLASYNVVQASPQHVE